MSDARQEQSALAVSAVSHAIDQHGVLIIDPDTLTVRDKSDQEPNSYTLRREGDGRILGDQSLAQNESSVKSDNATQLTSGWKLHVSVLVSKEDISNFEKAWDVILPVLIRQGVRFKAADPAKQVDNLATENMLGDEFTLYATDKHSPESLLQIAAQLEVELLAKDIKPHSKQYTDGFFVHYPKACRPVPGSLYVSYRNDNMQGLHKKEYISREDAHQFVMAYINHGLLVQPDEMSKPVRESIAKLITDDGILQNRIRKGEILTDREWTTVTKKFTDTFSGELLVRGLTYFEYAEQENAPEKDPLLSVNYVSLVDAAKNAETVSVKNKKSIGSGGGTLFTAEEKANNKEELNNADISSAKPKNKSI